MNRILTVLRLTRVFTITSVVLVLTVFTTSLWVAVSPVDAATGINGQVNFQGKLVDNNGLNVADNTYSVVFTLYDAASSGTNLWTETDSVTTSGGIFQVSLGAVNTALPSVNFNSDSIYLGIKVGADAEMTPRIRFTAVPYAFNAQKVNGLTVTNTLGNPFTSATTFRIADGKTVSINNGLTFSGTDSTTIIFQGSDTYVGRGTTDTLTNKTIGSTGLTFSGATTDITSGTDEDLTFLPNGLGDLILGTDFNSGVSIGSSANTPATLSVSGGLGSNAAFIVNQLNSGDLFVASQAGTTKFRVANNGDMVLTAGINVGGTVGSNTQCLLGGATAAWGACAAGGGGTNYLRLSAGGAFSLVNDTADFLFGNVASTSAKFKLSPSGTSPTASVSGSTSYAALTVDNTGRGDLFTASKSGATKFVITNAGNIGVGTSAPGALFDINGTSGTAYKGLMRLTSNGGGGQVQTGLTLLDNGNTTNAFTTSAVDGFVTGDPINSHFVGMLTQYGITGGLAMLGSSNASNIPGVVIEASQAVNNSGSNRAAIYMNASGLSGSSNTAIASANNVLQLANNGSPLMTVVGSGNVGIGTTNPDFKLEVTGDVAVTGGNQLIAFSPDELQSTRLFWDGSNTNLQARGQNLYLSADGANDIFMSNDVQMGGSGIYGNYTSGGNLLLESNSSSTKGFTLINPSGGSVGIGTNTPTATLDVRGSSGTTPVASVAGVTSNAAMVVDNSGVGDLFTASKSGATKFVVANNGNVGIGTGAPTRTLDLAVNNGSITQPGLLIEQAGSGDTGVELKNTSTSFYMGLDTSNSSAFTINSNASAVGSVGNVNMGQDYSSTSPNVTDNNANWIMANRFVATATGTISSINVAFATRVNSSSRFSAAIYSDSAGTANAKLGQFTGTQVITTPVGGGTNWNTVTLDSPISVTSGTAYWIAFSENDASTFQANNAGGTADYVSAVTPGTWASTFNGNGTPQAGTSWLNGAYATIVTGGALVDTYSNSLFALTQSGALTLSNSIDSTAAIQFQNAAGTNVFVTDTSNSRVGIGTGTNPPAATLDVRSTSGTAPTASISGSTSFAGLVVNNSGTGDLMTASSGGQTRFRMANNGSALFQGDTLTSIGTGGTATNSNAVINAIGDQGSIIPNAGFESNLLGGFADGWITAASNSATITQDKTAPEKGDSSLKVVFTNSSTAIYSACVPVSGTAGGYSLAYYLKKTGTPTATVRAYIDGYTSKANCQTNTSPSITAPVDTATTLTTAWKKFGLASGTVGIATAQTWGRAHVFIACTTNCTNATVFIDGIRFIQSTGFQGLDYAEEYPVDPANVPEAGDVVSIFPSEGASIVKRADHYMDSSAIGVISTNPGDLVDDGSMGENKVPVALAGRIPTKVSTKNGAIHVGDYLTSSDIPGVAVKAISAGPVIGQAMEEYTEEDASKINSVVMFVKNTYYNGIPLTLNSGLTQDNDQGDLEFLGTLVDAAQKSASSSSALTKISADHLVAGLDVITPKVTTDTLQVNTITSSTGNDVTVRLSDSGEFVIKNASGEAKVAFDGLGNAYFAGTITADKIKANQIEGLDFSPADAKTLEARVSALEVLSASTSALTPAIASPSASPLADQILLASIESTQDATVSGALRVKGNGLIEGVLHVVDTLTVGNLIVNQAADFFSNVIFHGDVTFAGHPTFNADTAGYVSIPKGDDNVAVTFKEEYKSEPVINASIVTQQMTDDLYKKLQTDGVCTANQDKATCEDTYTQSILTANAQFVIAKRSTKGFIIVLRDKTSQDMTFSWSALSIGSETGMKGPASQ